jgi:hypothetical protein
MKDIIVWAIHTPGGTIALVAAALAMFSKKGSARHKKAGSWFTVSMMIMLVSGIVAAYLINAIDDMMLGAIVLYTVFSAWLTVYHKKNETGILELTALIWVVGFAIIAFCLSMVWEEVETPAPYLVWGVLATLCALGDIRNLYYGGLSGTQRMIRHVWRIGFTLIWAALAFTDKIVKMMGANVKNMLEEQVLIIVAPPTFLILITVLYWITQILFFSREKFATHDKPIE